MRTLDEGADEQAEVIELGQRSLVHAESVVYRIAYHLPEAHMVLVGTVCQLHDSCGTDATSRIVDDALDGLLIVGVSHHSEVCDDVLDFLALIETQSAINAIRNALLSEFLLEATALRIGTIEDGKILIFIVFLTLDALDVLSHDDRLLLVAIGWLILYLFALGILAVHILRYLVAVVLDQAVGCLHDGLGGAIILLQLEEFGIWQLLLIVEDIVDVGTTETVDALRVITHGTHTQFFPA